MNTLNRVAIRTLLFAALSGATLPISEALPSPSPAAFTRNSTTEKS